MEKLKSASSSEGATKEVILPIETQEVPTSSQTTCSKKIKPRALIFKADDKDLNKIKELIETQFPEVEIIYVTTGPVSSVLHVTKSMPFEPRNPSAQPFYTIE